VLGEHAETDAFAGDCAADSAKSGCGFCRCREHGMIASMFKTDDMPPTGWVKPVAKPTRESLKARVTELRAELAETEAQLQAMEDDARLEALVKIRNLMRGFGLTPEDLSLTLTPKRRGRPPRKAVP
jgi:hypothetical protein